MAPGGKAKKVPVSSTENDLPSMSSLHREIGTLSALRKSSRSGWIVLIKSAIVRDEDGLTTLLFLVVDVSVWSVLSVLPVLAVGVPLLSSVLSVVGVGVPLLSVLSVVGVGVPVRLQLFFLHLASVW